MSFLNTLGKIFHVVQVVGDDVAPTLQLVAKATGNDTLNSIATGIMVAEQLVSTANSGTQKKQLATAVVNAVHPGLDQAALGQSIDTLVGLLNQLAVAAANVPAAAKAP